MACLFKCRVKRHCLHCRAAPEVPVPAPRGDLRCAAVTRRDNRLQLWEKVHLRMHRFKIFEMIRTDEKPHLFKGGLFDIESYAANFDLLLTVTYSSLNS